MNHTSWYIIATMIGTALLTACNKSSMRYGIGDNPTDSPGQKEAERLNTINSTEITTTSRGIHVK
ncbi:hypothetical protein [Cardinium endosymbiont of Nabis limbatus]|uniref:hypothetical protein n=1 Tax=Cardinium endosymbiont of Nabis limbatus TaxID=3066217 RepID=UPI003AF38512